MSERETGEMVKALKQAAGCWTRTEYRAVGWNCGKHGVGYCGTCQLKRDAATELESLRADKARRDGDARRFRFIRDLGLKLKWIDRVWIVSRLIGAPRMGPDLDVLLDQMEEARELEHPIDAARPTDDTEGV